MAYASQASQLVQQNHMMEAEICRLKNALFAEQGQRQIEIQRSTMLQQELRNAQLQKEQAVKRSNEMMSERRMMIDMKTEMANRIHQLEVGQRQLHDKVMAAERATEAKNEEIRAITYQSEIVNQQMTALNERNAALKLKCETMVGAQRKQCDEVEAKQKQLDAAILNVRKIEQDLQCANIEIQRLTRELDGVQQMESSNIFEKQKFDEILSKKEDEMRVSAHKSAAQLKLANEKIDKLENRLRQEKPTIYNDLTVFQESIYVAIETIKSTYEQQLSRLEEEIQELKNGGAKTTESDDVAILENLERNSPEEVIEELPSWLKTPMKPDPAKMGDLKKTIQCKINLQHSLSMDDLEAPPTSSSSAPMMDSEVVVEDSGAPEDLETLQNPSTSSEILEAPSGSAHNYTDEDLLLAESHEDLAEIQDLEAIEKQLLDSKE